MGTAEDLVLLFLKCLITLVFLQLSMNLIKTEENQPHHSKKMS